MARALRIDTPFRVFFRSLGARIERYFRGREVTKVLQLFHAQELAVTPGEQWQLLHQRQVKEIQAVKNGNYDIIDRRSWAFPYIPECCSDDTEFLTYSGFKRGSQLTKKDLLATRNVQTGELEWQLPTRIIKHHYQGPMVHFLGRGFDVLVTPNHRMFGTYNWISYGTDRLHSEQSTDGMVSAPDADLPAKVPGEYRSIPRAHQAATWKSRGPAGKVSGPQGFAYADDIKAYHSRYQGGYGFQVPFGAKWKGRFPSNYNPKDQTLLLTCRYKTGLEVKSTRPVRVKLKDFVAFLGLYTAEGYAWGATDLCGQVKQDKPVTKFIQSMAAAADFTITRLDKFCRKKGYLVGVGQVASSRHYQDIATLLARLPWNFKRGANKWSASSKTLHSQVAPLGNTYIKHVPQWVKDLPPAYLEIFVAWYTRGDGWYWGAERIGSTVSSQLADDLCEIYLKLGRQAKVTAIKNPGVGRHKYFGSDLSRCAPYCYRVEENLGRFTNLPRGKEVIYNGLVWCVSVPNGTIFVRRNGKGVWTGNSLHRLNQPI